MVTLGDGIFVWAGRVAQLWTEVQKLGTSPKTSRFHVAPIGKLAVVHVKRCQPFEDTPFTQLPPPRIFDPPHGWVKIFYNVHGSPDETVSLFEIPLSLGFRLGIFCTRYTRGNEVKIPRGVGCVIPLDNVLLDICLRTG